MQEPIEKRLPEREHDARIEHALPVIPEHRNQIRDDDDHEERDARQVQARRAG